MSPPKILLLLSVFLFSILFCGSAAADVWKWFDVDGKAHYVETSTSVFTWIDDNGKRIYADNPGHEDAVAVRLIWHAKGSLGKVDEPAVGAAEDEADENAVPDETPEQRMARESEEALYCKRAQEVYDSYIGAPRLYRTNDDGEREYLSKAEAKAMLDDTKTTVDDLCS
jgi:hypothetical protein